MNQFKSEKQNQAEVCATEREYKDYLKKKFGAFNQPYADDDGVILHFEGYYAKNALVGVSIDGFDEKKCFKTTIPFEVFESFIGSLPGSRGRLEDLLGLQKKKQKKQDKLERRDVDSIETETEIEKVIVPNKTDDKDLNLEKQDDEKSARLLEKERLVFEARKAYAKINFEAESTFARIKKILGEKFGKNPKVVPDVAELYRVYQERSKELRELKVDSIKEKYLKLSPEERSEKIEDLKMDMERLVDYFDYDEKIRLYEARTKAGAEAQGANLGGRILGKSAEWVNAYRKLNWKKKLLISGVLMAGGFGITMTGATGVGLGIGMLNIGQRIIGSAASGVGSAALMETISRKNQKKEAEKNKKAIFDEMEIIDERSDFKGENEESRWEDKFSFLEKKLNEEIETYAESLKNERRSVKKRFFVGLGVSAIVVSGSPAYLMKWGMGMDSSHGNFHWLSDRLGITKPNADLGAMQNIGTAHTVENINHSNIISPKVENAKIIPTKAPVVTPSAEQSNILPVKAPASLAHNISGSTGEKMEQVIELPKNIDTEKLVPGSVEKTLDGVKIKPKVFGNTLEHIVTKNENVEKIIIHQKLAEGMSRPDANRLAHQIASNPKNLESIEKLSKIRPGEKVIVDWEKGTVKVDRLSGFNSHHTEVATFAKPVESVFAESAEFQKEIIKAEELKKLAEDAYKRAKFFDKYNFTGARDALDVANKKYEALYQNIFRKISGDAFGESGIKGGLEGLKKIKAIDFISINEKNNPKFDQFLRYVQTHFGEKAVRVKSGETMFSWTSRVVGKIMASKGMEFDPYANKIYDISK